MRNKAPGQLMKERGVVEDSIDYREILNKSLRVFFKDALRVALKSPWQAYFFYRTIRWQEKAARVRSSWEEQDISVPPIMIFSITERCNLHCKGCYARALPRSPGEEMSEAKVRSIIAEARELGISFMILAGGEPFIRQDLISISKDFPEILFFVFTNGLLIDEEMLRKLKKQKNLVPLISLEGYEEDTDARRGKGVHERLQGIIRKVREKGIFFGTSLTLTRSTFDTLTSLSFVEKLVDSGCKLFLFLEYTAVREGTEDWILTEDQRNRVMDRMNLLHSKFSALFIAVPGSEEEVGGCLAAGRGFVHVSASGDVEPCPFAPYSDANLHKVSLKEALQSKFLRTIRNNHQQLNDTNGGCALWVKREWAKSLLDKNGEEDLTAPSPEEVK